MGDPLAWDDPREELRCDGAPRAGRGCGGCPFRAALVAVRALVMTTWLLSLPIADVVERERETRLAYWRARGSGESFGHPGWSPI